MTHNFVINFAKRDATTSDKNPPVWIKGTVDGVGSGYWSVSWGAIQQANNVGGVAAVRLVLAPILLGVYGPPYPSGPVFASSFNPPPPADANAGDVDVPEALAAGSWTA